MGLSAAAETLVVLLLIILLLFNITDEKCRPLLTMAGLFDIWKSKLVRMTDALSQSVIAVNIVTSMAKVMILPFVILSVCLSVINFFVKLSPTTLMVQVEHSVRCLCVCVELYDL